MGFQKVEFEFPDEKEENNDLEIEDSGAVEIDVSGKKEADDYKEEQEVEIEVVDDTPKKDRNRKASEAPEDVTEEELENYSEKVRKRIQHLVRAITMNVGLKRLLNVNVKSLKNTLNS